MEATGELCETEADVNFEWKIKDFHSLSTETGTHYDSPLFYCSGIAWEIWIYPNSDEIEADGWIGLYLVRSSTGYPETLDFSMCFKSNNGKKDPSLSSTSTFDRKFRGWGSVKFISRSKLLERKSDLMPSGILTVICTIKCKEGYNVKSKYIFIE